MDLPRASLAVATDEAKWLQLLQELRHHALKHLGKEYGLARCEVTCWASGRIVPRLRGDALSPLVNVVGGICQNSLREIWDLPGENFERDGHLCLLLFSLARAPILKGF